MIRHPEPHAALRPMAAGLVGLAAAILCSGCGAASPRFRTETRADTTRAVISAQPHDEDETAFTDTIRAELAREDDRKVDAAALRAGAARGSDSLDLHSRAPAGINRDQVLLDVVGYLGTPYQKGGMTKQGVDCSGFTAQVYGESMQLRLPRATRDQFDSGTAVSREALQFGDLVFFNTTGRSPSHVGIYLEDDLFAHASVTQGVTISSLESTYYKKRFVGARRIAGTASGEAK